MGTKDALEKVGDFWLQLLNDGLPKEQSSTMKNIISLNTTEMDKLIEKLKLYELSLEKLDSFMAKEKNWSKEKKDHKERIELLKNMLEYRKRNHIEMLGLEKFRKMVDIKKLKCIFSKTFFINFTVQENALNSLLSLQGYFLKNFIYFHLRHDMRFKAAIDSFMIEIDNPFTRHTIREENRNDPDLKSKYLSNEPNGLNVEQFCEHLLTNFFPKISGIWADHSQMTPVYILQFVRICLEYGFISCAKAKVYLDLLVKATVNLMKLEEGWIERPVELKKFSIKIKLFNVSNMFAKCREHIAMILINILVLIKDEYFMQKFPEFVQHNTSKKEIIKQVSDDFVLFNKSVNEAVLFITMNYLSNSVEILEFKSTTEFSQAAVEKIFFFLTTTQNDCFLNSLKQLTRKDLHYISSTSKSAISEETLDKAETMSQTMLTLLNCLGMGMFHKDTGVLNTGDSTDKKFEAYLKKYLGSKDECKIDDIFKKIVMEIKEIIKLDDDYKVAVVKESVPLKLVAFTHHCWDYFGDNSLTYNSVAEDCFKLLGDLCEENNFCKSQLFKYESLFHLKKLLKAFDIDAVMLLLKICKHANSSLFLGKEVFNMFLNLYERFNADICKDLNTDSPAENQNMEKFATLLLMIKYLNILFTKPFLNENDKLQNMLLAQEAMFESMDKKYLPMLLNQIQSQSDIQLDKRSGTLANTDFVDGNEKILFKNIKNPGHDDHESKLVLANHLAFFSLKLFNRLCSFGFSFKQYQVMLPYCEKFVEVMKSMPNFGNNDWMLPIGLEAELLIFIKSFRLLPQQNILIENNMTTIQKVIGTSWLQERSAIQDSLKKDAKHFQELMHQKAGTEKSVKKHTEIGENGYHENTSELDLEIKAVEKRIKEGRKYLSEFNQKEEELINFLICRVEAYSRDPKNYKEGEKYLYDGLFPLIFTYCNSILKLNLTDNSRESRQLFDQVKSIAKTLNKNMPYINKVLKKNSHLHLEILGLAPGISEETLTVEKVDTNLAPSLSVLKQDVPSFDIEKLELASLTTCELIVSLINELYEGATSYTSPSEQVKDLTKDEFIEFSAGTKFEAKVKLEGEEEVKQKKLKYFIKAYTEAKESYLNREEEPNLIGFFDRNNQNLRGVFNSCLDRLLNRKKVERNAKKQSLAYNGPISKFWTNRSVRGYIEMVVVLVSKSKKGRNELYEFIQESQKKPGDQGGEDEEEDEEEVEETAKEYIEKRLKTDEDGYSTVIHREDLLATLVRIHADLVYYLNASSSRHDIWWVTHQTYEMISMFFKNLCECNFMKFKDYLGVKTPFLRDQNWNKYCADKTYSMIFSMEFKSVMKTTRIAVNREPVMIRTDFHERAFAVLNPLLEIINEATIGPCIPNQLIFLNSDTTSLCNISLRLVDDLTHEFNEVATMTLSVVIALMEGSSNPQQSSDGDMRGVLEKLSAKLPASMLADRILRLFKKLYVKQLKLNGDYDSKVDEKDGVSFFKALTTKRKKKELTQSHDLLSPEADKFGSTLSKNKILPMHSELPIIPDNKDNDEKVEEVITEEVENTVTISHWKELLAMYMESKDFSGAPTFEFAFRMMVLWKNLAGISKTHSNRLKEIDFESNFYFKETGLFGVKDKDSKSNLGKTPTELSCVYYFLTKKIMCEVEVLDHLKQSVILYFPRMPATFMLAEEAKKTYREDCDIADSNTKMVDLMRNFGLFEIQMESSYQMATKLKYFYKMVSTDAYYKYTIFCWIIGFALNIALLVGLSIVNNSDYYQAYNTQVYLAILILAILLVCFSGAFLSLWLATKFIQTYRTAKEDYYFDTALKRTEDLPFKAKLYIGIKKSFIDQPFPMSYFCHVIFTILGLTVSPFFYTLNLLLIINFSRTTEFVLQAITLHIDQLALTLIMAIFMIYFYTLIIMDGFFDQINITPGNLACRDLYACFFFVFDYGLRNGGGFAESLTDPDPAKKFAGRIPFDLVFFMTINVISLNIILGIIIDTFSQLKDEENERNFENNCFVCGNTRVEFGKRSKSFDFHILNEHDPWKYIYFVYYLKAKGEDELSGMEYMAWTGFCEKEATWIPIGTTRYLDVEESLKLNILEERIENLGDTLNDMDKISQKIVKRMKKWSERVLPTASGSKRNSLG